MRVRNLDSSSMEAVEVMVVVMVDSEDRLRSIVSYLLFSVPLWVQWCGNWGRIEQKEPCQKAVKWTNSKRKKGINGRRNGMN